jgi:hypothetical protein
VRYVGNGGTVTFGSVTVPVAGSYRLTIGYTNGGAVRTGVVSVNGAAAVRLSFPPTGGFDSPGNVTVTVRLKSGTNALAVGNPAGYAPDLDRLTVSS